MSLRSPPQLVNLPSLWDARKKSCYFASLSQRPLSGCGTPTDTFRRQRLRPKETRFHHEPDSDRDSGENHTEARSAPETQPQSFRKRQGHEEREAQGHENQRLSGETGNGRQIVVKGDATSELSRRAVEEVAKFAAPGYEIANHVRVVPLSAPEQAEEIL